MKILDLGTPQESSSIAFAFFLGWGEGEGRRGGSAIRSRAAEMYGLRVTDLWVRLW